MLLIGAATTPAAAELDIEGYALEYLTIVITAFGAIRILIGGIRVVIHLLRSPEEKGERPVKVLWRCRMVAGYAALAA